MNREILDVSIPLHFDLLVLFAQKVVLLMKVHSNVFLKSASQLKALNGKDMFVLCLG